LDIGTGTRRKLLAGHPSFAELLRMVGRIGIPRLRFVTSHPINFDDEIIEAIADTPAVCRYIHLPVQSGANRVLKRMAREYTREYYLERVRRIRELLPDATLTTDIIVGFPGESEEDFQETLALYKEVEYDAAYMFNYSEREGTPATLHFDDIARNVKTERLGRLIELSKQVSLKQNQKWVGREVEVLIKGASADDGFAQGHTRGNHVVMMEGNLEPGIHQALVIHATPNRLYCRPLGVPATAPAQKSRSLPVLQANLL
jgi:tRNA-2-methylthio-N6-dimethylallyladenosine synthase